MESLKDNTQIGFKTIGNPGEQKNESVGMNTWDFTQGQKKSHEVVNIKEIGDYYQNQINQKQENQQENNTGEEDISWQRRYW